MPREGLEPTLPYGKRILSHKKHIELEAAQI
jgi:hypothetical protein